MKYYFTAQTHGISDKVKNRYAQIKMAFEGHGHTNTNYYQMDDDNPVKRKALEEIKAQNIPPFDYQTKILSGSDAVVCDVTENSATVGYQALYAVGNKIPCLALFFKNETESPDDKPSVVFTQSHNGLLKLAVISSWEELENVIASFETEFVNKPFKFNFYIPLNLHNGIARESAKLGKTKSDLVREIIIEHLDRVKEKED